MLASLWPQVITAIAALAGVFVTLIATNRRERWQLSANAKDHRERWLWERRADTYLALSAHANEALGILASTTHGKSSDWQEERLGVACGKLWALSAQTLNTAFQVAIFGSAASQPKARSLAQSISETAGQLIRIHDAFFRNGAEFGETPATFPQQPTTLLIELSRGIETALDDFLHAARKEFSEEPSITLASDWGEK